MIPSQLWRIEEYQPLSLLDLGHRYIRWLETKYSKSTIHSRKYYIGYFLIWYGDAEMATLEQITRKTLDNYQNYLSTTYSSRTKKPLNASNRRHYLSHLKGFFAWLVNNNYLLDDPSSIVQFPKTNRKLPQNILTREETEALINAPNIDTPVGLRDRTIFEIFYSTGIRRSELMALSIGDIDTDTQIVTIRQGKGHKDRLVPIGERALGWLKKYLSGARPKLYRKKPETANVLFLSRDGDAFSLHSLGGVVNKYKRQAGIEKSGCCHIFRHACASHMLENGASIRHIQLILGHASLDTTHIYTRVNISQLAKVIDRYHPSNFRNWRDKDYAQLQRFWGNHV